MTVGLDLSHHYKIGLFLKQGRGQEDQGRKVVYKNF